MRQAVVDPKPDVAFVAFCGYTTGQGLADVAMLENAPGWQDLPAVSAGRVYAGDGNARFNRPGPRTVDSLEILGTRFTPTCTRLPDSAPVAARDRART